jgi:uncharacterized protein YjbI with pentapeptide repeats
MTDLSTSSDSDRAGIYPVDKMATQRREAIADLAQIRARIADRTRWPCSWWWPLPERVTLTDDELKVQHDEVSRAINLSLLGLVAFSFFCELTLGAPDTSLLARDASIKLPLAGTEIYFATFLIAGPSILIAFSFYLQILIGYWLTLSRQVDPAHPGLPFIFNLRGRAASGFSNFLFYWLVPSTLAGFAWKALPRPEAPLLILFFGASTAALLFAQLRRRSEPPPQLTSAVLWLSVFATGCIAVFGVVGLLRGQALISRPLNLFKADLSKLDLRGANLSGSYLLEANLIGAHLEGANLAGAILDSANLKEASLQKVRLRGAHMIGAWLGEANLKEADLQGADLKNAVLEKADLESADLRGASLVHARLKEANLKGANLTRADLHKSDLRETDLEKANLTGADLHAATLKGANLEEANLSAAMLENASLSGANLQKANLRLAQLKGVKFVGASLQDANIQGADLTDERRIFSGGTNLSQDQINSAHGDRETKLPPEFVTPGAWKK